MLGVRESRVHTLTERNFQELGMEGSVITRQRTAAGIWTILETQANENLSQIPDQWTLGHKLIIGPFSGVAETPNILLEVGLSETESACDLFSF